MPFYDYAYDYDSQALTTTEQSRIASTGRLLVTSPLDLTRGSLRAIRRKEDRQRRAGGGGENNLSDGRENTHGSPGASMVHRRHLLMVGPKPKPKRTPAIKTSDSRIITLSGYALAQVTAQSHTRSAISRRLCSAFW